MKTDSKTISLAELCKVTTPGPWLLDESRDERDAPCYQVNALPHHAIADMCGRGDKLNDARMNGLMAVHSVNMLPQVVAALQQAVDDGECYCPDPEEMRGRGQCGHCKAKAILSRANKVTL